MAQIPFITDNARNRIPVNWYPAKDSEKGVILWGTPGLTRKLTIQNGCRGMIRGTEHIYGVNGSTAWRMDSEWNLEEIGTLIGSIGPVTILENGPQIFFVEQNFGYIYTVGTGVWADSGCPTPSSATYQDGYYIISKSATNEFYISGSYDGLSWDSLDYAVAESSPDMIVKVQSSHRELWILNKTTTEVWYNSGDVDFPFVKVQGASIEVGCRAADSVRIFDGSLVWLSDRIQFVKNTGYQIGIISTRKLEREIQALSKKSDAFAYTYVQDGHEFYVVTFPTDQKTWAYDAETKLWHQRESQGYEGQYRVSAYAYLDSRHVAGDFLNGNIYELDPLVYTEDGTSIVRTLETNATDSGGKLASFADLEVVWNGAGMALPSGQGSDPQAMLQWSDDGGATWSNEHWAPIGKIGKYKNRCKWNRLGSARDRVWRLMLSDPVDPTLTGAELTMTGSK
jgi:hypothetical protein